MAHRRIDLLVGEALSHGGTKPAPRLAEGSTKAVPKGSAATDSPAGSLPERNTRTAERAILSQANGSSQPDCRRCQHFAVSWEPAMPYLCRGFGFKSRTLPSWEVQQADGHPCRLFAARR
jgi:hypothetical protein